MSKDLTGRSGEIQAGLLRKTVGARRTRGALQLNASYVSVPNAEEKLAIQLNKLNEVWAYATAQCPYWIDLARKEKIPPSFDSVSELCRFPVMTKSDIQQNYDKIFTRADGSTISSYYMTSGSTGEPTRYPRGKADTRDRVQEVFAYRAEHEFLPFDRFVYFGGLPGSTVQGRLGDLKVLKRYGMDFLGNSRRVSGYQIGSQSSAEALSLIRDFKPKCLIGFPSKLVDIARYAQALHRESVPTNLELVILSSENFTEAEAELISQTFDCRVISEYGAEEIGVIAASGQSIFPMGVRWRYVALRMDHDSSDLLVSTLGHRAFPLFQYSVGDSAEPGDVLKGSIFSISRITGRSREKLQVGTMDAGHRIEIMPLHFMNFLKANSLVRDVQFFQRSPDSISVYVGFEPDATIEDIARQLTQKLRTFYPELDLSKIAVVESHEVVTGARSKKKVVLDSPHPNTGRVLTL